MNDNKKLEAVLRLANSNYYLRIEKARLEAKVSRLEMELDLLGEKLIERNNDYHESARQYKELKADYCRDVSPEAFETLDHVQGDSNEVQ